MNICFDPIGVLAFLIIAFLTGVWLGNYFSRMNDAGKILDRLKKHVEWGMEVDRNHLFSYHNIREMITEVEERDTP